MLNGNGKEAMYLSAKGMLNIKWSEIDKYTDEDITYFLFLEGKSIECLCRMRNLNKEIVQKHILDGKIKYGILAKSNDEKELFSIISKSGKQDKIEALRWLNDFNRKKLIGFIRNNYADMKTKDKESAVWILGEVGDKTVLDILIKASVHNHVNVRRMAVSAVGKIGDKNMEIVAIRALDDENPQVAMYAIKALTKIKSESAGEKIKEIYEKAEKAYIKKTAKEYFEEVRKVKC
jgi:HEAT repeat protein